MSIREMDSQIELYGTKLPLLKLFVMTDEEVNFYANLKTIEQYNDYVRDLLMKFDLEKYMKEKGVQNAWCGKRTKNLSVTNKIQFEKYLSHAEIELKNNECFKKITYLIALPIK